MARLKMGDMVQRRELTTIHGEAIRIPDPDG